MENTQGQISSIIMEGDDIIEISSEVVISQGEDSQRNKFYGNVEEYRNSLALCMREKSMITIPFYNNIVNTLKLTKGGKKTGVTSKFLSWCKAHFKIDSSAGFDVLCSSKNGNRIATMENYYEVCAFLLIEKPFRTLF